MTTNLRRLMAPILCAVLCLVTLQGQELPAVKTIAGNGTQGFNEGSGQPLDGSFNGPHGLALDRDGSLLVADVSNHRIRRITRGETPALSTVAGNGAADLDARNSEGVDPTKASLAYPWSTAVDSAGNIFIADSWHNCIRKITPGASPTISTVVSSCHALNFGFSGDGGDPQYATLNYPTALAFDPSGNLFVADRNNLRIRKITFGTKPAITTVVGNGQLGVAIDANSLGDGGDPKNASLAAPTGLAFDSKGNLYIADTGNERIRKVTFGATSTITTAVGDGASGDTGYSQEVGDGGDPRQAHLYAPNAITIDSADQLFIADTAHGIIRKVTPGANPVISTIAGSVQYADPTSTDPLHVGFIGAYGLVTDLDGNLYIADQNNTIRLVSGAAAKKVPYATNISLSLGSTQLKYPGMTSVLIAVSGTSVPTGTVNVYDASKKLTTLQLQKKGTVSWYIYPGLDVGAHLISVSYNGDARNIGGQSAPTTVTVAPAAVDVSLACSGANKTAYQCAVLAFSPAGLPTGSVSYTLDSNPSSTTVLSWGTALIKMTSLSSGSHKLSVYYPAQGNFGTSKVISETFVIKK